MARVLIVDDEPAIRENLHLGLTSRGFETVLAAHGEEAITAALRSDPDVILLDVMMPKINGMNVCEKLKMLLGNFVPIILLTALADVKNKVDGFEHGADDYVTKPFKIEELAARITSLLRIKNKYDSVKEEALTDFLTALPNRRGLNARLLRECLKAQYSHQPLSCLLIDLDNFKELNDRLGHVGGDQFLRKTARLLEKFVRPGDFLARYGGDEFILLAKMTRAEAEELAERVRTSLENGAVTASIGVCEFATESLAEPADLIKAADHVLYKAKENGRNCVAVFKGFK